MNEKNLMQDICDYHSALRHQMKVHISSVYEENKLLLVNKKEYHIVMVFVKLNIGIGQNKKKYSFLTW